MHRQKRVFFFFLGFMIKMAHALMPFLMKEQERNARVREVRAARWYCCLCPMGGERPRLCRQPGDLVTSAGGAALEHFRQEIRIDAAQMIATPPDMDVGKIGSHRLNVVYLNKKKVLEGLSINVCSSSSILIQRTTLVWSSNKTWKPGLHHVILH